MYEYMNTYIGYVCLPIYQYKPFRPMVTRTGLRGMDRQRRDNRVSYRLVRYSFLHSLGLYLRLISTKDREKKQRCACFMVCATMALSPRVLRPSSPYQLWSMYRCSLLWAVRFILIIRSHGTMHKNEVKKMAGSQASNNKNKIQPYLCARVAVGCSHRHQKAKSLPSHIAPPPPYITPTAGRRRKKGEREAVRRQGLAGHQQCIKKSLYSLFSG